MKLKIEIAGLDKLTAALFSLSYALKPEKVESQKSESKPIYRYHGRANRSGLVRVDNLARRIVRDKGLSETKTTRARLYTQYADRIIRKDGHNCFTQEDAENILKVF